MLRIRRPKQSMTSTSSQEQEETRESWNHETGELPPEQERHSGAESLQNGERKREAWERQFAEPRPEPPRGAALLLRRLWIVLLGAILVGAATYFASKRVAPTYSSTADVLVLVSGGTDVNDTTLGANNLADQDAQLVDSGQVLSMASHLINKHLSVPKSSISGGTVGAQNLIQVQATAGSPSVAQARAAAVTQAFIHYITQQNASQVAEYQQTSNTLLKPLDANITRTENELNKSGLAADSPRTVTLQQSLNTLLAQRASAMANIASAAAASRSTLRLASTAGVGAQIAPRPTLYATVGFIVALLVLLRAVTYIPARGPRRP